MSVQHVQARPGVYADSVTLMQLTAQARAIPGVQAALVAMATELTKQMLADLGFPDATADANDLLVAVRADGQPALDAALAAVSSGLGARPAPVGAGVGAGQPPRTIGAAARAAGPGLAMISVPGQHAFAAAMDALDAGCDVMIFSDNVPVWQEIVLKDTASERGLLVMGPDCGTAVVGGIGLGFCNAVRPGPVGLVAASGTGAQQVLCLLDAAGIGVSAVLGTGGRDLSAAVGGRSARAALTALDDDPGTELIVLVSKPPDPAVASELREYARELATPVQFALTGAGQPDLTTAAESAIRALARPVPAWSRWQPAGAGGPRRRPAGQGALRGLFAGGTLCDEAMVIATERLGSPVYSNVPLQPQWQASARAPSRGHTMIDFGDDELTAGRPHPMIDPSARLDRLVAEAADPATAVILLDVVLGHGAHPDPAGQLGPAIAAAVSGHGVPVVASLIGTAADPQGLAGQARSLCEAGAWVFASNAQAARFGSDLAGAGR